MKFLLIAFMVSSGLVVRAQTYKLYQTDNINNQLRLNTKTGEVYQIQNDGQKFLVCPEVTPNNVKENRYTLEKTKNIWTFILLDRITGKLWQCQYSVQGINYISSWVINPNELSTTETEKFTVQPLISMYQFYLINDETGEMWKFQWTTKGAEYRWIQKM